VLAVVRNDTAAVAVAALGAEIVREEEFPESAPAAPDVVLELVGAPHVPANLEALAPKGRIVVVGVGAGHEVSLSLLALMQRRASIRGTVLRSRPLEEKAAAVRAFEREVVPGLASGRMRSLVDSVFPAERVVEAFERLEASGKVGKVLLEFA
jgi:NADPH:quinone reductase-like Zn-dependent oxidoreductase